MSGAAETPRTAAGRDLLERLGWFASEKRDALREGILAIEAEARPDLVKAASDLVRAYDEFTEFSLRDRVEAIRGALDGEPHE